MDRALRIKINIFEPDGIDWMNMKLSVNNPYTRHHIKERRNGGDNSLDNLAILTKRSHNLLNILDRLCPDAYNDLQNVFRKINETGVHPSDEIINEIDLILYKVLISKEYEFKEEIDLSSYIPYSILLRSALMLGIYPSLFCIFEVFLTSAE